MKMLFITDDPTILDQGSSGHARARANALAIGELHVLICAASSEVRDEGSLRISAVRRGRIFPYRSLRDVARTLIKEQGMQAIWSEDPFELGTLASSLAEEASLPLYVNVYTDFLSPWYSTRTGMFRSSRVAVPKGNRKRIELASRVLTKAAGIRVMSERVKSSLLAKYGKTIKEPVVIPIQVNMPPPEPVRFPFTFPFNLVAAGRLDAGRRVIDVIDALALIKDRYPGVGLFVVGDGPERARLERYAKHRGLAERVIFLGDRRDAWGLIRSANVFVQASAHEGFGRRLMQAALARVPIITSDVGIVGEVFKGYDDVLAMPPGDPAALSIHIIGLIEDGQARSLLSMNAEAAAKRFLQEAGDIPQRLAAFFRPASSETGTV
jgi:glycosyltransferase involved in cell wall biosynthesis